MNVFSFTGNIGKDCRVGGSGSGAYCGFSVASKSGYGDKAQTNWIDCTIWGKQAEGKLPEYLLNGQQVAISGELGTCEHDGKTSARRRSASACGRDSKVGATCSSTWVTLAGSARCARSSS